MSVKTTVDGKTVNVRTREMLELWQFNALTDYYVVQGSYNSGVSQSAGTHDGGGAVDLSLYGIDDKPWHVKQGRLAGWAAYWRRTLPGVWNEHIHAIAIGDDELSSGARAQVADYYDGQDALAGSNPDPDPRVKPIPVYPKTPKKRISLLVAYRQFKAKKPVARTTVARIQWVLNEKTDATLTCDGVAGPATRAAYLRWERKIGAKVADGVPGRPSLTELGKGRFKVNTLSYEKWRKQTYNKARAEENEKKNPTFPQK
jgi:hypothetical protein